MASGQLVFKVEGHFWADLEIISKATRHRRHPIVVDQPNAIHTDRKGGAGKAGGRR